MYSLKVTLDIIAKQIYNQFYKVYYWRKREISPE